MPRASALADRTQRLPVGAHAVGPLARRAHGYGTVIVRAAMTLGVPPREHDAFVFATLGLALPRAMRAQITDAIS